MTRMFINSILLTIGGLGFVFGITMNATVPEPTIMLCFGTGLLGMAGILKLNRNN